MPLSAIRHDDDLERRSDLQPTTAMMIKNPQPNATAMTMNRHLRLSFDLPKCVERMKNRRVTDRPKPSKPVIQGYAIGAREAHFLHLAMGTTLF